MCVCVVVVVVVVEEEEEVENMPEKLLLLSFETDLRYIKDAVPGGGRFSMSAC